MTKQATKKATKHTTAAEPVEVTRSKGSPLATLPTEQERIVELALDMATNGAFRGDLDLLLRATLRHEYRRKFPTMPPDLQDPDTGIKNWGHKVAERIIKDWPEQPAMTPEQKGETVSDAIKANIRRNCRLEFEQFMGAALDLADVWLLADIMNTYVGFGTGLGEAFISHLASADTYVKVRHRTADRVRKFAALIEDGVDEK